MKSFKNFSKVAIIATFVAVGFGCSHYNVPATQVKTQLQLTKQDIILKKPVKGRDYALGIFPIYLYFNTAERAVINALGDAHYQAFERDEADFVFKPKSKVTYYWFIIFDYASSEVIGKSAVLKQ